MLMDLPRVIVLDTAPWARSFAKVLCNVGVPCRCLGPGSESECRDKRAPSCHCVVTWCSGCSESGLGFLSACARYPVSWVVVVHDPSAMHLHCPDVTADFRMAHVMPPFDLRRVMELMARVTSGTLPKRAVAGRETLCGVYTHIEDITQQLHDVSKIASLVEGAIASLAEMRVIPSHERQGMADACGCVENLNRELHMAEERARGLLDTYLDVVRQIILRGEPHEQ